MRELPKKCKSLRYYSNNFSEESKRKLSTSAQKLMHLLDLGEDPSVSAVPPERMNSSNPKFKTPTKQNSVRKGDDGSSVKKNEEQTREKERSSSVKKNETPGRNSTSKRDKSLNLSRASSPFKVELFNRNN